MDKNEEEIWEYFLNNCYSFKLSYCDIHRSFGNPGIECVGYNFDFLKQIGNSNDIPIFRIIPGNLPPIDFVILSQNNRLIYFFTENIHGNLKLFGEEISKNVFGRVCIVMNIYSSGRSLLGFRFMTNEHIEGISDKIQNGEYIKKEISGRKTKGVR